ncbi:melanoma-associated antigen 4-like [Octodon degus]|uniref:Melanoma-associated antigen 4-like n=1 Tax=Octodon degus TaxID=10160 RepID=A0A6P3FCC2_OCTDE|nr:melanoma-associated antigen 4-like [Octodon degus]
MMPHGQKSQDSLQEEEGHPGHRSARVFPGAQALNDEETAATTSSSASSCSFTFTVATGREQPGPGSTSGPLNPEGLFALSSVMASSERKQYSEGSSSQQVEGPSLSQDKDATQIRKDAMKNDELDTILRFLLQKYQKKEQITMGELEHMVAHNSPEQFHVNFAEICECMHLGLGIIVREVGSPGHTYELVPALGLTYNGVLDDADQIIPKADLLILILSTIFLMGNRVSEEQLRDILRHRKVLAERSHIAVGDPWKFIREDLVRAEYLVYQQVHNSVPARCEFLLGPRALAETTKMKVLNHVIMLAEKDPGSCPYLYEQAMREHDGNFSASVGQDDWP